MLRLKLKAASGIIFLLLNVLLGLSSVEPMVVRAAGTVSDCSKFGPGPGTLEEALPTGDVITFACSGEIAPYETLVITGDLTLDATGQTVTLKKNILQTLLSVKPGVTLTLKNLTITGQGSSPGGSALFNDTGTVNIINTTFSNNVDSGGINQPGRGGAIRNINGSLNISNSTFSKNSAGSLSSEYCGVDCTRPIVIPGDGGAIYNEGGTATITNSTFSDNGSYALGGAFGNSSGTVTITNSTFSGNRGYSYSSGGALYNGGGTITVGNSTFSGNFASTDGGAIYNPNGSVNITNSTFVENGVSGTQGGTLSGNISLANTILAYNYKYSDNYYYYYEPNLLNSCAGTITDLGNNLQFPGTSCGNTIPSLDPKLGSLADNGGLTKTRGLYTGSPALDSGNNARCNAAPVNGVDQRGVARPVGSTCDIGAFEGTVAAPTYVTPTLDLSFLPLDPYNPSIKIGDTFSLRFSLKNPNPAVMTNVSFTNNLPPGLKIVNLNLPYAKSFCYNSTFTAVPGSTSLTISNLTLLSSDIAAGYCTFNVQVTSDVPGTLHNTVTSISSDQTGVRAINAQADVQVVPNVTASYSPSSVPIAAISRVSLTVSNPGSVPLTNLSLQTSLSRGISLTDNPNIANICSSGTVAVVSFNYKPNVQVTGITLAAGQSCTLSFDVVATELGTQRINIYVNSNETGMGNFAVADAITVTPGLPAVNQKFSPANIAPGTSASLIFTLTNPNPDYFLTDVTFSDNLPSQITVAAAPGIKTDCTNATITAVAGSGSIKVSGVNLKFKQSCTISVEVTSNSVGSWDNTTGVVSSSEVGPGTTSNTATLTVTNNLLVTNASDSATTPALAGSLRAAVNLANTLPGGGAVSYNSALGPVTLAAPLVIGSSVRIQGSSCANPVRLNATFPNALQLAGNTTLQALQISSTVSPALKVTKNGNRLVCVRVSH